MTHTGTGTYVYAYRSEYVGLLRARFDLTVGTNGELWYVNNDMEPKHHETM